MQNHLLQDDTRGKEQLANWLSFPDININVLYNSTVGGHNWTNFTNQVVNKGGSLIFIVKTTTHVFGAFLSIPIPSPNSNWQSDSTAWLFKLYDNNNWNPQKYPVQRVNYAFYINTGGYVGFGDGDLCLYFNQANLATSYSKLGKGYSNLGQNGTSALAGKYNSWSIMKIEIWQVSKADAILIPIEKVDFTPNSITEDKNFAIAYNPDINIKDVKYGNIIIVGGAGAGKSALLNSYGSIFLGRKTDIIRSVAQQGTVTTKLSCIPFDKFFRSGKFAFWDTMGWGRSVYVGTHASIISQTLDGMLPHGTELTKEIPNNSPIINKNPTLNERMHCMVLVVPAEIAKADNADYFVPFKTFIDAAAVRSIATVVVMTKCDLVDTQLITNPEKIFASSIIRTCMVNIQKRTGVNADQIYPVINLVSDKIFNPNNAKIKILLVALRKILYAVDDFHISQGLNL